MGITDGKRRHYGQQRNRENVRPSGQMLSRDGWEKHVYPQLPEGRGETTLTPTSTYTITACQNK